MASKPATTYLWDSAGTNAIAPTAGHQSDGYATDEVPACDEWNGLLGNITEHCAYLADGALEGDHSIDGALEVTGDVGAATATITGDASVAGTLTYGAISHGDEILRVGTAGARVGNMAPGGTYNEELVSNASPWSALFDVPLPQGCQVKSVAVVGDGTAKALFATAISTTEPTLPAVLETGRALLVHVEGSSVGDTLRGVVVTYDRPAP